VSCLVGKVFVELSDLDNALSSLSESSLPVDILRRALSAVAKERFLIAGDLAGAVESDFRARLSRRSESIVVPLSFALNALQPCLKAWSLNDVDLARNRLIEDLNEALSGEVVLESASNLRLVGSSCLVEAEVAEPQRDRIRVSRVQVLSAARADVIKADAISLPRFAVKADVQPAAQEGRRSIKELLAFLESETSAREAEKQKAQRERVFELFSSTLREKERYYRDNRQVLRYRNWRGNQPIFVATLEGEVDPGDIAESLIISLPNNRSVVFDVIDVQFDQIRVRHRFGPIDAIPSLGTLETNRAAQLQGLEKQRTALELIRGGRAVSPNLYDLICDPQIARPPEAAGVPDDVKDLSADKYAVLDKALGVQDFLVVEGPPGTGKTTLIAELIVQYLRRYPEGRVLLSSQTHAALDHVLGKLRDKGLDQDLVRITRSQEAKVDGNIVPLLLNRKLEQWGANTEAASREFLTKYAERSGLVAEELQAGILGEERLRRLARVTEIEREIAILDKDEASIEDRRKQSLQDAETVSTDTLIEETSTITDQRELLTRERDLQLRAEARLRERLANCGEFGREVAGASPVQVEEWIEALLPSTEAATNYRSLVQLQQQWLERLGASQEFIPAVLGQARVVAGTCVGLAGVPAIYDDEYDLCIIDEASKATATETLIPMARSRRWILVGDPEQLPPFVEAGSVLRVEGFSDEEPNKTLLDHLLALLPDESKQRLIEQRRMTKGIGELFGTVFYKGRLRNIRKDSERADAIRKVLKKPVTWISTSKLSAREEPLKGSTYRNRVECDIVAQTLRKLDRAAKKANGPQLTVAVIAGYAGQVRALRETIGSIQGGTSGLLVECNTVDAFQGKDADVCIYSVTSSNTKNRLGFQRKKPRLNVALSRARDALVIVGDLLFCRTCKGENPFPPVIEFIESHAEYCGVIDSE
jgi:hypothetical protein